MANVGRPLKFKTVKELQSKIDEYFASCHEEVWVQDIKTDDKGKVISNEWVPVYDRHGNIKTVQVEPYLITGLALALGTTRDLLADYENKDEYSDTIKRAKEIIHNYTEKQLMIRDKPTGVIFNLKNNYGWRDKNETELTGKDGGAVEINVNIVEED